MGRSSMLQIGLLDLPGLGQSLGVTRFNHIECEGRVINQLTPPGKTQILSINSTQQDPNTSITVAFGWLRLNNNTKNSSRIQGV